jgi:type IV secretion system protein VirB8
MDAVNQSINEALKSGRYFEDALEWYHYKYVYPFAKIAFLLVIAISVTVAFVVACHTINKLLPLHESSAHAISVKDTFGVIPNIHSLAKKEESPQYSLASYLLSHYVMARESYAYKDLDRLQRHVKSSSSPVVYRQYIDIYTNENIQNPKRLYENIINREVEITEIKFIGTRAIPSRALVSFLTRLRKTSMEVLEEKHWVASVNFNLPNIEDIANLETPDLKFVVNNYAVRLASLEQASEKKAR